MTICWFHFFLDDFFQVRDGFDSQPVVLVEAYSEFSLKFLKEQHFFAPLIPKERSDGTAAIFSTTYSQRAR